MPMMHNAHEEEGERRYDPETLRKVTALAARLQSEHQEKLTMRDMEQIGAEVGLQPTFIRQALAQHNEQAQSSRTDTLEEQTQTTTQEQGLDLFQEQQGTEVLTTKAEFYAAVTAFALPMAWGTLAYLAKGSVDWATLFTLITPAPLAALLGFLSGRRAIGAAAAMTLVLALAPTFPYLFYNGQGGTFDAGSTLGAMCAYSLCATPMLMGLGTLGAALRERFIPTREQMEGQNQETAALESAERQKTTQIAREMVRQHRACLSIDVVEPTDLRHSAATPLVEQTFLQYRRWVEEVATSFGGELHSALGDSMLFLFPTDSAALRVARRLQDGSASFNAALNRLPLPFRLRCGVSAGEVSEETHRNLHHLHSPMFDRAATLQHRAAPGDIVVSGEVAAAALVELETLTPLAEPVFGAPAFSWRNRPAA